MAQTDEESKKAFLYAIKKQCKYWSSLTDQTPLQVAEGVAFSILVMIDGESPHAGPFALRQVDEDGKEGNDIAGHLHDEFCKIKW